MDVFRFRPLFFCAIAFILASAAGFFLPLWGSVPVCIALLLWSVAYILQRIWRRDGARTATGVAACLAVLCGFLSSQLWFAGEDARLVADYEGEIVTVSGTVVDRRGAWNHLTSYVVDVESFNGRAVTGDALLTCHYVSDLRPGMNVTATVTVVSLEEAAGSGYDAVTLQSDGFRLGLLSESETDVTVTREETKDLRVSMGNLRRSLAARLELLTEGGEGLPAALLLGERSGLGESVRRDFSRAGVSHMLAISGLHVTLLFGILAVALSLFRVPKRLRGVILGILAVGYLILLGFPSSATRAVIMLVGTYVAACFFTRSDGLTMLGLAGAVILVCTPYAVADAGFWMSFLATLGILTVLPLLADWEKKTADRRRAWPALWQWLWPRLWKVLTGILVGVVATGFTLLVVALVMGEVSLLSPLTTLLLTPLCGLILILSPLSLLLGWMPMGEWIGDLVAVICRLMTQAAAFLGEPAWVVVSLKYPLVIGLIALCFAALPILLAIKLPEKWRAAVLIPVVCGWLVACILPNAYLWMDHDRVEVTYLQPSSKSEALVMVSGRESVICDLSDGSLTAMSAALREAESLNATEVSALVLTHYHGRTAGTLSTLLRRETVRALWCPEPQTEDEYFLLLSYTEQAEKAGVPLYVFSLGETVTVFDSGEITLYTASLDRSTQSVLLLSCSIPRGDEHHSMVYMGGAVFESDLREQAINLGEEARTIVFGSHGPVIHSAVGGGLTYGAAESVILSAYGDVAPHLDTTALPADVSVWYGQKRLTFREGH